MKKKITVVFLLILIAIFLWYKYAPLKPAQPVVRAGSVNIPVFQGSYCWSSFGRGICVDTVSPPMIVEDERPIVLPAGSEISIHFKRKPQEGTLTASIWGGKGTVKQEIKGGGMLVLPEEPGVYIYSLHARWDEGSSSYVFVVEAKKGVQK